MLSQVWWCTHVNPSTWGLKQGRGLQGDLDHMEKLYQKLHK